MKLSIMEKHRHGGKFASEMSESLINSLPVSVAQIGRDLRYQYLNQQFKTWFCRPDQNVLGKHMSEVLGEDAYSIVQSKVETVLQGIQTSFEAEIVTQDGKQRHVETNYIPFSNEQNELCGFTELTFDLTELRETPSNTATEEQENLYKTLIDYIPNNFIWLADNRGHFIFFNRNWSEYTGLSMEQSLHQRWTRTIHPEDINQLLFLWSKAVEHFQPCQSIVRLRSRNGNYRTFEFSANPIKDYSGPMIRWIGVFSDIDDIFHSKQMLAEAKQAAEEANKAKSAFLAHISHEIRTPLTSIIGYADILKNQAEHQQSKDLAIEAIYRNGQHLLSLLHDVIDLAKVESGQVHVELKDFDLREEINTILTMFQPRVQEKQNLELTVQYTSLVPTVIKCDPVLLRQILVNIVGNAVKFTESGSIEIKVHYKNNQPGKLGQLRLSIKDSGIGIPTEVQANLFQAFYQGKAAIKKTYGGTGLGLTISRQYARILGGELVLVQSKEGYGSEFALTLPVEVPQKCQFIEPDQDRTSDEEQKRRFKVKRLSGKRILLVEDSPDIQLLIGMLLRAQGAQVETAADGEAGIRRAQSEDFDLVLMDIQMPVLDGYEACRRLRAEQYSTPIIAMTAHVMTEEREQIKHSGFDDCLSKPIDFNTLFSTIERYIRP